MPPPSDTGAVDALVIVDFQNDFASGGALAVPDGDAIATPIDGLLDRFELVVATRDWHPADHASFRGAWPVHCVQGTWGAELHPALDRSRIDVIIDKGRAPESEGYSAFEDTDLEGLLRARGVDRLYVAGLATDYCVRNTVLDACRLGFAVVVLEDAIRGVNVQPGDSARAIADMRRAGAIVSRSTEV